jgi:hypothetical protein
MDELPNGVKAPTKATLSKYGLNLELWTEIMTRQGWCCAICKTVPSSGRLHIEHHHVKGWKKMPPEQRRLFIRGVACWNCNTQLLGRGLTIEKAKAVVLYMEEYKKRLLANNIDLNI